MKPWKVLPCHWGKSDIAYEAEQSDRFVNGVPHKYVAEQLEYAAAKAIVDEHNAAILLLLTRGETA